jgi:hypothetical protein
LCDSHAVIEWCCVCIWIVVVEIMLCDIDLALFVFPENVLILLFFKERDWVMG